MFVKLISSVIYAVQKSAINNLLGLFTSIITVSCLYILPSSTNDENLIIMAWVHICAAVLPQLAATIIVFFHNNYKEMAPSFKCFDLHCARSVLSLGGVFLYIQVVYMLIMSTNEYMITAFVGNEFVVEYQIYYRLFTLPATLFALAMTPIWSSVTKAIAQREYIWVKKLYQKAFILGGIFIIGNFLIVALSQFGIDLWLGDESIEVNYFYAASFAILGALMILNCVLSTFANGAGRLKTQSICFTVGAIVKIPTAFAFLALFDSWIAIIWASNIALVVYCIVEIISLKQYMKKV